MITCEPPTWTEENQRRLGAAVSALLSRIKTLTANPDASVGATDLDVPTLEQIGMCFALSPFERGLLLLAAAVECNGSVPAACAAANGDARRPWPTLGLALSVLPDGHWSALSPDGPLRRFRLVHLDLTEGLTWARVRCDERVLHLLIGLGSSDQRLAPYVNERPASTRSLPASQHAIAEQIAQLWSTADAAGVQAAQLCGADRDQRRAVVDGVAQLAGSGRVIDVDADALPAAGPDLADLIGRLARECVLTGAIVSWRDSAVGSNHWLFGQVLRHEGVRVIAEGAHRVARDLRVPVFDVPTPTFDEQRRLWRDVLPDGMGHAGNDLAKSFVLTSDVAASIVDELNGSLSTTELRRSCRLRLRSDVGGSAVVREPTTDWSKLVLPKDSMQLLHALETEARFRAEVHEKWGLDQAGHRARGTSALFCGPSGTGKSFAAEVIAGSLGVDLLHVDLSQVVNKYIGETEKNLSRVFDAGERGGAVLLFDECDALFGKRTEIKDSHDRYANIEVSYLLQRMEAYSGVAVLTTNLRANLDPAFVRRLRFIVTFPHPARAERERIWSTVFPDHVDVSALRPDLLAGLDISGGLIANIAMAAAMRAASDGTEITMRHVRQAAAIEYAKLERPLTGTEIEGWS